MHVGGRSDTRRMGTTGAVRGLQWMVEKQRMIFPGVCENIACMELGVYWGFLLREKRKGGGEDGSCTFIDAKTRTLEWKRD